jgi:hypothetical protein
MVARDVIQSHGVDIKTSSSFIALFIYDLLQGKLQLPVDAPKPVHDTTSCTLLLAAPQHCRDRTDHQIPLWVYTSSLGQREWVSAVKSD